MHQGAISNIVICRDRFNPEEAFDSTKTLEKCGVISEGEVKLFYDFTPVTNPLLVWKENMSLIHVFVFKNVFYSEYIKKVSIIKGKGRDVHGIFVWSCLKIYHLKVRILSTLLYYLGKG